MEKKSEERKRQQGHNPYLPEYEYIPDGEPHVFGERVYIFGSHDRFGGKKFCMNDYVCYSAPVTDLTSWVYEGVIYRKTQDPRMRDGTHELWAPDVVRGKDGRYYLYYCPDDKIRSIGVAVCDQPVGQYEFLGIVSDKDGNAVGERPGDTIAFDPGIFIDDDGEIYLYSGNGPRTNSSIGKEPKASVVMRLEDDMVTIKSEPKKLLPILRESQGTGFEGHEFFEASSIRKISETYYLVYSSCNLHELCYAVSKRPDGEYRYGGVIVSNCDVFSETDRTKRKNCFGNNHGGIECINGEWYVFYHRQTNRSMFSRQGCVEKIQIHPDGHIEQVEMTSQGSNGKPLEGEGIYPASMVCNLYGKKEPVISHSLAMGRAHPYLTQDGPDFEVDEMKMPPRQYIKNGKNGFTAVFRYFNLNAETIRIGVKVRGNIHGTFVVRTEENGKPIGRMEVKPAKTWTWYEGIGKLEPGVHALYFCYEGRGKFDLLEIKLEKGNVYGV